MHSGLSIASELQLPSPAECYLPAKSEPSHNKISQKLFTSVRQMEPLVTETK